jgi:hypothetical protein
MGQRDGFTPEEWRTLQLAPFWMFSAVVGAYNRFDQRDYRAFVRCLEAAAAAPGRVSRQVLASVVAQRDALTREYGRDQRTIGVGLGQVAALLEAAGPDEALLFKGVLVRGIGEGVARARGRYGEEVGEDDARSLTLAAQLLSFDVEFVQD